MQAVTSQTIPSFYTDHSKNSLFVSANTYEKYIVSKEYCIARRDDKMSFLSNCRTLIILSGDIEELLQKLDAYCFKYQQLECLYILFKYRLIVTSVVKSRQLFDNVQKAAFFNQQNKRVDRMPSIAKNRLSRKKYRKQLQSSIQRTK